MIVVGPINDQTDWNSEESFTIIFHSFDELRKGRDRYFNERYFVLPTSPKARPGQTKQLFFRLPGGDSFSVTARVRQTIPNFKDGFSYVLFRLENFNDDHLLVIDKLIKSSSEIRRRSDSSIEFAIPPDETGVEFLQVPPEVGQSVLMRPEEFQKPKKKSKPRVAKQQEIRTGGRTKKEDMAIRALMTDEAPDEEALEAFELPKHIEDVTDEFLLPTDDDDPFVEVKKQVVSFILLFTKAIQRTGYYADPNHPETQTAKRGLYALFRTILGPNRQVTFIRKNQGKYDDLLVDGVMNRMISFREIMPVAMIELYLPRFMELLERRGLVSFTVARSIDEGKFDIFVDHLADFSGASRDNRRGEGERFTHNLRKKGIFEVSVIFDEDLISSGRKLPWQAELTLSRLNKDLKTIPLLKNATEEEIRQIKLRIFQDIIRPLRTPTFLLAVLLNADLVTSSVNKMSGLEDLDVEEYLIHSADMELLVGTAKAIVKSIRNLEKPASVEATPERLKNQKRQIDVHKKLLSHFVERFSTEPGEESDEVLEFLHEEKLVIHADLPMRLQRKLQDVNLADTFAAKSDYMLEHFRRPSDDVEFMEILDKFKRIILHLYHKQEYALIAKIVEAAKHHRDHGTPSRKSQSIKFFEHLASKGMIKELHTEFNSNNMERCQSLADLLVSLEDHGIPVLLDVLRNNDTAWIRKLMIKSLIKIGSPVVSVAIDHLHKADEEWFYLRNLLNIVAEIGDPHLFERIKRFVYHDHPAVRRETLSTLYSLDAQGSLNYLVVALGDDDHKVRQIALTCLGKMKSLDRQALRYYMDVLNGRKEQDNIPLQIQVCQLVGVLDNADEAVMRSLEGLLVKKLEGFYAGGIGALFHAGESTEETPLKLSIVGSLAKIGYGPETLQVLNKAKKDKDKDVKERAHNAILAIEKRLSV